MAKKPHITVEELRRLVSYDEVTGIFTWLERSPSLYKDRWQSAANKASKFNRDNAGKRADVHAHDGYRRICIPPLFGGGKIYAHHAAWIYVTGEYVENEIDHLNNDPSDNRFLNLRPATSAQQKANKRVRKDNALGVKGVGWVERIGKYKVTAGNNGKSVHIGLFDNLDDAKKAYAKYAEIRYGEFARLE